MKKDDIIQSKENPLVKAKVNWVVDDSAGITYLEPEDYKGGGNQLLDLTQWDVIVEAEATFQSSVEHMSEEELRAQLERLRGMRSKAPSVKVRKVSTPLVDANDPLAKALAELKPEEIIALKKKMGLL